MMPPPCQDTATHFTLCYFIYFDPWASLYRNFLCGHADMKQKQASLGVACLLVALGTA
jgi:hypothetical protein